jgi:hypothetical protein
MAGLGYGFPMSNVEGGNIVKSRVRVGAGSGLACLLFLWGASGTFAQAQIREETRTRTTTTVRRASAFIGSSVELQAGGTFGRVEDLVINDEGCIDFVVVMFEEKLIAVPFTLTRVDFERKVVFLNAQREFLLRAPTFTRDRFPDLSVQSEFGRRVNTFFKESTNRRERGAQTRPSDRRQPEAKPPDRRPADQRPPEERQVPKERKAPGDREVPKDRKTPDDRKPPDDRKSPDDRKPSN